MYWNTNFKTTWIINSLLFIAVLNKVTGDWRCKAVEEHRILSYNHWTSPLWTFHRQHGGDLTHNRTWPKTTQAYLSQYINHLHAITSMLVLLHAITCYLLTETTAVSQVDFFFWFCCCFFFLNMQEIEAIQVIHCCGKGAESIQQRNIHKYLFRRQ